MKTQEVPSESADLSKLNFGQAISSARSYAEVRINQELHPPFTDEQIQHVKEILKSVEPEMLNAIVEDKFTQMHDAGEAIAISLKGAQELILYGPPGYGKSDVIKFVLQRLNLDVERTCHKAMFPNLETNECVPLERNV